MTPGANDLCVFAVKRGKIESRLDTHYYLPEFQMLVSKIRCRQYEILGNVVNFSKETTDFTEYPDNRFEYLEISGVSLGSNVYETTITNVEEAPSRAKMKTNVGDIAISTTRPHRGAIVEIVSPNIIASTGFSIIRKVRNDINKKWLLYVLLSNISLRQMLQRSSGGNYPAIIEDEIKRIIIPIIDTKKQKEMVAELEKVLSAMSIKLQQADDLLAYAKRNVFNNIGILFSEFKPSLFSYQKLSDILEYGIYCNPHSAYLNEVFEHLRINKWCAGHLEDYVDVNPRTDRSELTDDSMVSFVPMPAVDAKTNNAEYETKKYAEVKTGFTIFQKNDLLWAKITPCMQNGKSFIASDMPTEIGFGSTEFHVLRQISDHIYMPYLWVLLSESHVLEAAQGMFSGSAGQQRVPDTFLKKFPIVLPPLYSQKHLADAVFEALDKAKQMRTEAEQDWATAKVQFEKELLGGIE